MSETNTQATPVLAKRSLSLAVYAKKAVAKSEGTAPVFIGHLVGIATEADTGLDKRTGEAFKSLAGDFRIRYSDGSVEAAMNLSTPQLIVHPVHAALTATRNPVTIDSQLFAVPNDQSPSGYEWRIANHSAVAVALPAFRDAPALEAPKQAKAK